MKKLARTFSTLSLIGGILNSIRPGSGLLAALLWMLKLLAGALSPVTALLGGIGALLGILSGDTQATATGALGAGLNAGYIRENIRPHDQFEQAFGPHWRQQIPPQLWARLHPDRWTGVIPPVKEVRFTQDVPVGVHVETGDPLYADLWQPPDHVPHTGIAVLYCHGSGWAYADKDTLTRNFFSQLAAQGHVVVDLAYTLLPNADLCSMVADVYRGIHWIKTHADDLEICPEHVVLMGASAGGQISLLAGYANSNSPLRPADLPPTADLSVRGIVAYYPVVDMVNTWQHFETTRLDRFYENWEQWEIGRQLLDFEKRFLQRIRFIPPYGDIISSVEWLPRLLGGTPAETPEMYELGTVITHVGRHCPPTLFLQGTHDIGGMLPDVRRLHRALVEAEVPAVLVEFPDTEHVFDLVVPALSPPAQAALYDVERFLAILV